jgi:hypothetical protein
MHLSNPALAVFMNQYMTALPLSGRKYIAG